MDLKMVPTSPIGVAFSDDQPPISLILDDFSLVGYGPVEHRTARLLRVDISSNWMLIFSTRKEFSVS